MTYCDDERRCYVARDKKGRLFLVSAYGYDDYGIIVSSDGGGCEERVDDLEHVVDVDMKFLLEHIVADRLGSHNVYPDSKGG